MGDLFGYSSYAVRKRIFNLWNTWFRIVGPDGEVVFTSRMKAFKLKEDIRVFGADKQTEILRISARQILDFGATYDVVDARNGERLGAFRRKGLKSMFRDEWLILDTAEREVGMVQEESGWLAFLRRFTDGLANLFAPQRHVGQIGNTVVLLFRQSRNPFLTKTYLDFSMDSAGVLDRRMGIALAVLFGAIDGKQG